MTDLSTLLPALDEAAAHGLVTARRHPALPLTVYNYTEAAQYAQAWSPAVLAARGLVLDDAGQAVARPWPKFFNAHEHDLGHDFAPPLPDEPFELYEKVDGSLAIIFWYAGAWQVCTRGSFESDQAQWAQRWLDKTDTTGLTPGVVYLAEALYPRNRVVVDYGDTEDLVLLGAVRADGTDLPLAEAARHWDGIGSVVRAFTPMDLAELSRLAAAGRDSTGKPVTGTESEGWVARFASGVRVKVKLADYVRLAAVVGEIGTVAIWRREAIARFGAHFPAKYLARSLACPVSVITATAGDYQAPMREVTEEVPDEYHQQVRDAVARFDQAATALLDQARATFTQLQGLGDRAAFARAVKQEPDAALQAILFLLLDGKDKRAELHAWVAARPEPERLFRTFNS